MSDRRGSLAPMLRLDRDTTDRLLSGRVLPEDAPPGYAEVARVLLALGSPPTAAELRHRDHAVAAAARRATTETTTPPKIPRRFRRSGRARVKVLALTLLGSMVATSGLAMAGMLPDAAQNVVSDVLSKVGLDVPKADDAPPVEGVPPAHGAPPAADWPLPGLGLQERPTPSDATGDLGIPGAIRRTGTSAPAPPHGSGTGRANEASGGKSEDGTTTADERSGGHSAAGAHNADGRNEHASASSNAPASGSEDEDAPERGNGPPPRGERSRPSRSHRP